MFILPLLIATVLLHFPSSDAKTYKLKIAKEKICSVDRKFLSVAIGAGDLEKKWKHVDFKSTKLKALLKHLKPAYLRFGGTKANFLIYEDENENPVKRSIEEEETGQPNTFTKKRVMTEEELKEWKKKKKEMFKNFKNFTMTPGDFDNLYRLADDARMKLLFDLNAFLRAEDNSWDSTNAVKILDYAAKQRYNVDWQLGNEPNSYKKHGKKHYLTGTQIGKDFVKLKHILDSDTKYGRPKLVGLDTVRPKKGTKEIELIRQFLVEAKDAISALTWHQYYVDGKTGTPDDFVDPDVMEEFRMQNDKIDRAAFAGGYEGPVWLTETGSAWGGGADGASNRYAAGFLYLDKLGMAAYYCRQIVVRQSFLGGKYAMVDWRNDYRLYPDYFSALLHKRLVGREVFRVDGGDTKFRVYAHCANRKYFPAGAVTVIILNVHKFPVKFSFDELEDCNTKAYILTADKLDSEDMMLNGKKLELREGYRPPRFEGEVVKELLMPALSYGFFVVEGANENVCKD